MSMLDRQSENLMKLHSSQDPTDQIRGALRQIGWISETQRERVLTFLGELIVKPKAISRGLTEEEIEKEIEGGRYLGRLAKKKGKI